MSQSRSSLTVIFGKSGQTWQTKQKSKDQNTKKQSTALAPEPEIKPNLCPTLVRVCGAYLPPNDSVTKFFGPFDEDILSHSSLKSRIGVSLIAGNGRILKKKKTKNGTEFASNCHVLCKNVIGRLLSLQLIDYQDEDESHALSSHAVYQRWKSLELWVQYKVQLTFHVVNICILHIL